MMLPLHIAKALQALVQGGKLPASSMKHRITDGLVSEGIIAELRTGRKSTLYVPDAKALADYLHNHYGIVALALYIQQLESEETSRAGNVMAAANSKLVSSRAFSGFLVNSYMPIACTLNSEAFTVDPAPGTFQFVHDFAHFIPPQDAVIVGVENAENFTCIRQQAYLFAGLIPLFISRYPQGQGRDAIRWLQGLPNRYLHFGDFDFAGINIYLSEYKKHLGSRATFFMPNDIEALLAQYGNRSLYDKQTLAGGAIEEPGLLQLTALIHKHKKGLEQEALLIGR